MNRIVHAFKHFFSYDYLFGFGIGLSLSDKIFFAISLIAVISGIVYLVAARRSSNKVQKDLYNRFRNLGLTMGLLGLLWTALRYERAFVIADRIVFISLLVIAAIWKIKLLRYWFSDYKVRKDAYDKELLKKKYM